MKLRPFLGTVVTASLFLFTSCQKEGRNELAEEQNLSTLTTSEKSAESALLKAVRQATARFHSTQQAMQAGYMEDHNCVSVQGLGGMGFHWANPNLIDGVFDPLNPEVVLYAPGPNGNLKLVAVEYIVLKPNPVGPTPMFGTQPFDNMGTPVPAPHWSLHVWLFEENPSGMFNKFNPNVSCK